MYLSFGPKKEHEYVDGSPNYQTDLEAQISFTDLEGVCLKGYFSLKVQNLGDGGKQIEVRGTGKFIHLIHYRLYVSPSGRVFLNAMFYRSIMKMDAIKTVVARLESEVLEKKDAVGAVDEVMEQRVEAGSRVARILDKDD